MNNKYLKIGAISFGLFFLTLYASTDTDSILNEDGSVRYQGVTYQPEDLDISCDYRVCSGFNILSGTATADVSICLKIKATGLGIPMISQVETVRLQVIFASVPRVEKRRTFVQNHPTNIYKIDEFQHIDYKANVLNLRGESVGRTVEDTVTSRVKPTYYEH